MSDTINLFLVLGSFHLFEPINVWGIMLSIEELAYLGYYRMR